MQIKETKIPIRHFNIPIFIPELACPFQCVFCNQQKISGQHKVPSPVEARSIIDGHLKTLPDENSNIEIAFFGGNFTGIPLSLQEEYLANAYEYLCQGRVSGIRLSTRPDYINKEVVALLKKYGVTTVELGAQSFDDEVLIMSGRGHKVSHIVEASRMIIDTGFSLGLQMMIGLPGDTEEKSLYTAGKISEMGADNTRIYPTLVIKGTALEKLFTAGKYYPLTLEEAISISKKLLLYFEQENINVLRVGLHPSEGLLSGDELTAGPFHLSFRELVLSEIWLDKLNSIKPKGNGVIISVSPSQVNHAVGYKSVNKAKLQERFRSVKFIADTSLKGREFNVIYN
jgi:histone acetyltransferase (RNA polymerase elongator complex component)